MKTDSILHCICLMPFFSFPSSSLIFFFYFTDFCTFIDILFFYHFTHFLIKFTPLRVTHKRAHTNQHTCTNACQYIAETKLLSNHRSQTLPLIQAFPLQKIRFDKEYNFIWTDVINKLLGLTRLRPQKSLCPYQNN